MKCTREFPEEIAHSYGHTTPKPVPHHQDLCADGRAATQPIRHFQSCNSAAQSISKAQSFRDPLRPGNASWPMRGLQQLRPPPACGELHLRGRFRSSHSKKRGDDADCIRAWDSPGKRSEQPNLRTRRTGRIATETSADSCLSPAPTEPDYITPVLVVLLTIADRQIPSVLRLSRRQLIFRFLFGPRVEYAQKMERGGCLCN